MKLRSSKILPDRREGSDDDKRSVCSSTRTSSSSKASMISKIAQVEAIDKQQKELRVQEQDLQARKEQLLRKIETSSRSSHHSFRSSRMSITSRGEEEDRPNRKRITVEAQVEPPPRIINAKPMQPEQQQPMQNQSRAERQVPHACQHESKFPNHDLGYFVARQSEGKQLPMFSGDPMEWPNFISQFRRTTRLCGYSNEENLSRLQRCLTGEAKNAVYALLALPDGVDKIMEILQRRFGRAEYVIGKIGEQLLSKPSIKEGDYGALVAFSSEVQNYVTTIEILDSHDFLREPSTLSKLTHKLPGSLRVQWGEHVTSLGMSMPRINEFAVWLERRADAYSVIAGLGWAEGSASSHKTASEEKGVTYGRTSSGSSKGCRFCSNGIHNLGNCEKWLKEPISSRWTWASKSNVCFRCLKPAHSAFKCRDQSVCTTCKGKHHTTLHKLEWTSKLERPSNVPVQAHEVSQKSEGTKKWTAVLKVLPVRVSGPSGFRDTYALLDEGSCLTMIESNLAQEIGLKGEAKPFSLSWTGNVSRTEEDSEIVTFKISKCSEDAKQFSVFNARTVKDLALQPQSVDVEQLATNWPYIKKGEVTEFKNAVPRVIVGQDNWPLLFVRKSYSGPWRGPVISLTWLGWVLYGNIPQKITSSSSCSASHFQMTHWHEIEVEDEDQDLTRLVENNLILDNLPVVPFAKQCLSEEDQSAIRIFDATTRRIGPKWETGLLWKKGVTTLPNSRAMAEKRFHTLEKRFERDPAFAERYTAKMEENFTKGYARYLNDDEARQEGPLTWYLPHLGVINPNKPQKLRVCFDASAKAGGFSFNDFLYKGPDLYVSLPGLLLNFRRHQVAFTGDIREMYPQIRIRKDDQDGQRFLWRGKDKTLPVRVCVMEAMIFGTICSPYAAQEIKSRNAEEFQSEFPEAYQAIKSKHYMDDYVDCAPSVELASKLVSDVIEVHARGGFVMCNWVTNSAQLRETIPLELRDSSGLIVCKILGMTWNHEDDNFEFIHWKSRVAAALKSQEEKGPTKREVLRLIMSLFDPLGMVTNVTLPGRILFQDIWKKEVPWDDRIEGEHRMRWNKWLKGLDAVTNARIPRMLTTTSLVDVNTDLHIFCDASQRAYCAVAYLRVESTLGVEVAFAASRARVAALKPTTIPRLELQGALLAVRLTAFVLAELEAKVNHVHFWSDSQIVLHWIRATGQKYKPYVANRVAEILEGSKPEQWRWVPTTQNPADMATRENMNAAMDAEEIWFKGPQFLYQEDKEWPREKRVVPEQDKLELVGAKHFVGVIQLCKATSELPDIHRFSKWFRLIRATAWIIRLRWNARHPKRNGELLPEELEEAEMLWCLKVQEESFQPEIKQLQQHGVVTERKSRLIDLAPFLEDKWKLICVQGRIGQVVGVDQFTKTPIILDPNHRFTMLLIRHYHERAAHTGQRTVFTALRQRYWILQGKRPIQKIWNACVICQIRRAQAKTVEVAMGELPAARLEHHVRPFTNVGVDYFGPIFTVVGRRREKRYGALFTCLSTRAVHLEMAYDLSTGSALMAIRQFIARRGQPKKIYSDNGTNFQGANRELQRCLAEWDQNVMEASLASDGMEWHFIPPSAPHMGGCWERLVRSVKSAMEVILHNQTPRDEVLLTVFAEVEGLLNSRPLTEVPLDKADAEPLTPNHFLIGTPTLKPMVPSIPDNVCLKQAWRTAQQLTDQFWKRWIQEYLPALVPRTKWKQATEDNLQVGTVVIIVDTKNQRGEWPKGIVTAIYPGRDRQTRVVDVRVENRGIWRRPTRKLCPLKLTDEQ